MNGSSSSQNVIDSIIKLFDELTMKERSPVKILHENKGKNQLNKLDTAREKKDRICLSDNSLRGDRPHGIPTLRMV